MNYERFIGKRLLNQNKKSFSKPILFLSVLSIALGISVMIIAYSIGTGFQITIEDKVAGFDSHIQISRFDYNDSYELSPIEKEQDFVKEIRKLKGIKNINPFAIKGGIAKNKDVIQGVVLKGVDSHFDWSSFKEWMVEGRLPEFSGDTASTEILISKKIAQQLNLQIRGSVIMYFIQDPPKIRKFIVCGIYHSGLEEFDTRYIMGDLRQIQKLNNWTANQVAGYDINLTDYSKLDKITDDVYQQIPYDLKALNLKQRYAYITDWLKLLDKNVYFIIGLMMLIAGITMISTLLILILEQTNMIGILKAMGSHNSSIQKIFLYQSFFLIGKGLIYGNLIGVGICYLQKYFSLIPLNAEHYYMDTVPININFTIILLINAATIIVSLLMLLLPSRIISKVQPVKAIKFN